MKTDPYRVSVKQAELLETNIRSPDGVGDCCVAAAVVVVAVEPLDPLKNLLLDLKSRNHFL